MEFICIERLYSLIVNDNDQNHLDLFYKTDICKIIFKKTD
jgi:hypothetical protein